MLGLPTFAEGLSGGFGPSLSILETQDSGPKDTNGPKLVDSVLKLGAEFGLAQAPCEPSKADSHGAHEGQGNQSPGSASRKGEPGQRQRLKIAGSLVVFLKPQKHMSPFG